jgi:hypothetical protein
VQAQLANGNLRARARISSGNLVSLSGSLNLMADRLMRFEQVDIYAQKLTRALNDLSHAFERYRTSGKFVQPPSCNEFPEIQRLLLSMGMKQSFAGESVTKTSPPQGGTRSPSQPLPGSQRAVSQPLTQRPASAPLPQRLSTQNLSDRPASAPLPPPNQRSGIPPYRSGSATSGTLRGPSSARPLRSGELSERAQMDFPLLPKTGED